MPENLITSTREISPADTISGISPLFSRYDIHGFAEHRPRGLSLIRSVEIFRGNPRSGYLNLGKGFGLEAALASGYMEAIEVSTIEQVPEIRLFARPELGDDATIYSVADNAEPDRRFILGTDLLTGRDAYGFCDQFYLPAQGERPAGKVQVSTNGLASGNTLAEARLHAVYELIERHVGLLGFHAIDRIRALVTASAPSPLKEAIAEIEALGVQCEFFRLGRLFDVHVIQCLLVLDGSTGEEAEIHTGWGAHHSPAIAVSRAVAEAVQAYAIRSACRSGAIPPGRMTGGLLISAEDLTLLRSGPALDEHAALSRLRGCAREAVSLEFGEDEILSSPERLLDRIVQGMRDAGISHLFSWTLSPGDRPFSVVRCVVPEFGTFVP